MSVDVFQLDWIFIDTFIIFLLILLLLGVKIYKKTHRWRSTVSNQNLKTFSYSNDLKVKTDNLIRIKKCELIKNDTLKKEQKRLPTIVILNNTYKKKLITILIEGLGSYGFNLIHLKFKILSNLIHNSSNQKIYSLISNILLFFKNKSLIEKRSYIVLNYINPHLPLDLFFSDNNNDGIIQINPKLSKLNTKDYENLLNYFNSDSRIFAIFSKRSICFIKNKNLRCFMDRLNFKNRHLKKLLIIEKAQNTFKYYETILLGMIIDIIENDI